LIPVASPCSGDTTGIKCPPHRGGGQDESNAKDWKARDAACMPDMFGIVCIISHTIPGAQSTNT